jgi:hypothetical protein
MLSTRAVINLQTIGQVKTSSKLVFLYSASGISAMSVHVQRMSAEEDNENLNVLY